MGVLEVITNTVICTPQKGHLARHPNALLNLQGSGFSLYFLHTNENQTSNKRDENKERGKKIKKDTKCIETKEGLNRYIYYPAYGL